MPVLVSVSEVGLGRRFTLDDGAMIGRAADCAVQLVAADVSKHHARVFVRDGGWLIEDMGSRNGVFVQGERVSGTAPLVPNGFVAIGATQFIFEPEVAILPADSAGAVVLASDAQTVQARVGAVAAIAASPVSDMLYKVLADTRDNIVDALVCALGHSIGFDDAAVLLRAPDNSVDVLWTREGRPPLVVTNAVLERCARERTGLVCSEQQATTPFSGATPRSLIVLPLILQADVIGAVVWARDGRAVYDAQHLARLVPYAPLIALSVGWQRRLADLQRRIDGATPALRELVGDSAPMQDLRETIVRLVGVPSTVLIHGESGTGKELAARALHTRGPFIAVNCAAIPESLVESELFGHERGAFSGADRRAIGKLELAHEGTLFLDEVGELSASVQAKLLRALEERSFYRVGGAKPVFAEFRLIAASHRDLAALVRAGRFRDDLYYRLNVVPLEIPPLRSRGDDIVLLAARFLEHYARSLARPVPVLSDEACAALVAYDWPGNVRELRNVIERAVVLCAGEVVTVDDLSLRPLREGGVRAERERIADALRAAGGKKVAAAKALGISRPTLDKKIAEYGLSEVP